MLQCVLDDAAHVLVLKPVRHPLPFALADHEPSAARRWRRWWDSALCSTASSSRKRAHVRGPLPVQADQDGQAHRVGHASQEVYSAFEGERSVSDIRTSHMMNTSYDDFVMCQGFRSFNTRQTRSGEARRGADFSGGSFSPLIDQRRQEAVEGQPPLTGETDQPQHPRRDPRERALIVAVGGHDQPTTPASEPGSSR